MTVVVAMVAMVDGWSFFFLSPILTHRITSAFDGHHVTRMNPSGNTPLEQNRNIWVVV